MLDQKHLSQIGLQLPFLAEKGSPLAGEFQRNAYFARIPAGREIFVEGDEVDGIALMMSGVVRVYKIGDTGREITLYRFGEGESCVITANAILNTQQFPAIAVVERAAEAIMIPSATFADWVDRYAPWRNFVFNLNAQRLARLMDIVDQVAFQRMDHRIAAFLLDRSRGENPVRTTHQAIANELGSSREVVSRLLEDLANRNVVALSRGAVTVLDRGKLAEQLAM